MDTRPADTGPDTLTRDTVPPWTLAALDMIEAHALTDTAQVTVIGRDWDTLTPRTIITYTDPDPYAVIERAEKEGPRYQVAALGLIAYGWAAPFTGDNPPATPPSRTPGRIRVRLAVIVTGDGETVAHVAPETPGDRFYTGPAADQYHANATGALDATLRGAWQTITNGGPR